MKADVQQVGNELVVSGLESAMSLIQTARNLLNAVVLTVKAAYIASTKVIYFLQSCKIYECSSERVELLLLKLIRMLRDWP